MIKIDKPIIVEGKYDKITLENVVDALIISTDGFGIFKNKDKCRMIKMLAENFEGKMLVGAGTVLTKEQVDITKASGGKFIISPDANAEVIKYTKEKGLVSMPGALTPTEIQAAHSAGADFVKLFPITNMGVSYVKAVSAPLKHIKLIAVGGVDANNMAEYLEAGAVGFGLGSNIVDKKMLEKDDYASITALAEKCVNAIK